MKCFFKNICLFCAIPLCLVFTLIFILNIINQRAVKNYKVKTGVTTIFIGDSHVQLAINDAILPNCTNLSQRGESLFFSFFKLKKILQNNPTIKKVYVGIGYHSISSYFNENAFADNVPANYFFIVPFHEKINLVKQNIKNPGFLISIISSGIKTVYAENEDLPFSGKYENVYKKTAAIKEVVEARIKEQFYKNNELRNFSKINIDYFNNIVSLCKNKNIEIVALKTPTNNYYNNIVPSEFRNKYDDIISFNKIQLVDFANLKLEDSCFLPDGDHVSQKGAFSITNYFRNSKFYTIE